MPHISVKMRAGYSAAQKLRVSNALVSAIVKSLDCPRFDVSVAIEDVRRSDWNTRVRDQELSKPETIYKLPGYALDEER